MNTTKLSVALAKESLNIQKQSARGWLQRTPAGRTATRVVRSIVEIEFADRAMTLAAQGFISVLPVIIAVGTFAHLTPAQSTFADEFGLNPSAMGLSATSLDAASTPTVATFGLLGVIMVLLSGTSFARALGRLYGRVWGIPTLSIRGWWRWVAVLIAVAIAFGLVNATNHMTGQDWIDLPLGFVLQLVFWFAAWSAVPYLLTEGRLSGRVLWATAALTAVGLSIARIGGRVYLPLAAESAHSKFGTLGLVFTSISWMFVLACVVVAAAATIKALALDEGSLGRLLRGRLEPPPELTQPELTRPELTPPELAPPGLTHSEPTQPELAHSDLGQPESRAAIVARPTADGARVAEPRA